MNVRRISTVVVLLGLLATVVSGFSRTTSVSRPISQQRTSVSEGVRAVLVDVVIRDRRGQLVRDLTQADFEVTEDGTTQKIGSFTPVFDGSPEAATAAVRPPANSTAPSTGGGPALAGDNNRPVITALVFDRLSPESQRLAVQAAQGYLGNKEQTQNYVGIFGVDQALAPYSPFTRNAVQLRQALAKVAGRSNSSYNSNQQQKAAADQTAAAASRAAAAAAATAGPGTSNAMGSAGATAQLAQMESQMISDFDAMERDQQGYSLTNGLFAIIGALGRLPGRKSMVLFSEGVAIPPAVQRLFRGVIDAANRANVSIYTMDAVGLRAVSPQAEIRDKVNEAAGVGINTAYSSSGTGASEPLTKGLEANEDVLTQDPHNGLGQLSQETGGLIFDNTNNLRQGFDRVEEDLHNYYLLGYTSSNDNYDGKFRKIEIKVNRPGVVVSARKGYFAVRNPGFAPVNAWEAPALGVLEQKPLPNGFPVRAGALSFPERGRPGLTPVLVEFQTAPLTFQPSADGKTYSSDFAVIVRFLDDQNQVARKVSQHYEINGPIANLENAKKGDVIFYREPELAPGFYTMETIVYDTPSAKSSVRLSTVQVARLDDAKLRVSSLLLVKRGEKVPEKDRRPANPLMLNDVLLYPNLGEAVSKAAKEVSFYFTVYPASGGPAPEAMLELLQNGQRVVQVPMPLGNADGSGRIQQAGRLPIDQIPPGTYELRAIVKQGSDQIARTTMLRLSD